MVTYNLPPGPKSRWPGQGLVAFRRDPLGYLHFLAREYGDVVALRVLSRPLVLLTHPDTVRNVLVTNQRLFKKGRGLERTKPLLGDGLLTSEGEFHLRQRRLAQPAFHRDRVAAYARTMIDETAIARTRWRDGETVELANEMTTLTLSIVGKTLFGADVEAETLAIRDAIDTALDAFRIASLPFTEVFDRLPMPWVLKTRRAKARLDAIIYRMIAERRGATRRTDLLSMLLDSRDTEGDGSGMSDAQLRDELLTIFLAGHETTANALTWIWYALSQAPAVADALYAEVAALGDRTLTPDDLPRLAYTRAVASEGLRLYPPAWIIGRRALADYRVGGYDLPAGTYVFLSPWITQRDPRYWPDAERFDPTRWLGGAADSRPKFAYFPFGGGSRLCIGESFAWTEIILVLATIAQQWRFDLAPGHIVAPKPVLTLRPRHGMRMIARRV